MHDEMTKKRCPWVRTEDPLMLQYHDREWGVPVHDDRKHFEFQGPCWQRVSLVEQSSCPSFLKTTTRFSMLHPVPEFLSFNIERDPSEKCICHDSDFLARYQQKYTS
jgi:hypothetical protein